MASKQEIIDKYTQKHSELENRYYVLKEIGKEEFDQLHGQIWEDMEAELIAEGHLPPPVPPRDLKAELDDLKLRVKNLEEKGAKPV